MSATAAPTLFSGPVSAKNTKKHDLVAIAQALGLDGHGTKDVLVSHITGHLRSNPGLAQDPRFQGLFIGRANNPKGAALKNSAEKAREDGIQASTQEALTGAHQALLNLKYTTDPLAQYHKLNSGASGAHSGKKAESRRNDKQESDEEDDISISSLSATSNRRATDQPTPSTAMEIEGEMQDQEGIMGDELIMVVLQSDSNPQEPPREAHVTGVPILVKNEDGRPTYSARITDIVPEVFGQGNSLSPIKTQNTRLYRQGVADPHSRSALGLVDDIIDPARRPKALNLDAVNRYSLVKKGDIFACRLFYKEAGEASVSTATPLKDNVKEEAPLVVAQRLAAARKAGKVSAMDSRTQPAEGFHAFLRAHFGVKLDDIPLGRANEMRVVLDRHRLLTRCMDKAGEWKRKAGSGGYRVPDSDEYNEYAGLDFTKATIKASLSLTGTKSGEDESLLSDHSLAIAPKALDWARNPESEYCEKFDKMSPAQFKNYLKRKREDARNHSTASDDGSDSGSEAEGQKRKDKKRRHRGGKDKAKKRGKREYSSEDLDG